MPGRLLFVVVGLLALLPPFALCALLLPVGQYPLGAFAVGAAAVAATVPVALLAARVVQRRGMPHVFWVLPLGACFVALICAMTLFAAASLSGRVESNDEAGLTFAFFGTLPLTVPLCLVGGVIQAALVALLARSQGGQR